MTTDARELRVALVTGAANGLGFVIARRLSQAGYKVALGDIDTSAAKAAAEALGGQAGGTVAVALDVTRKDSFERALADLTARWGGATLLVNNAAMTVARPAMEISGEEFDSVIAVNLRGTFFGCQVFGAHFCASGFGRIVNLASLAGQNGGTATGAHYAASKGGIVTLTKVFARDFGPYGVTVNAIAPGPLDLPAVHRTVSPERLAEIKRTIPVGDIGSPEFVGDVVVQLASPQAAFANGSTIDLNGGLYMR